MDNLISFEELAGVSGEVLPERTVMGIMAVPFGPGDGGAGSAAGSLSSASANGGGDHGTTVLSSCQSLDHPQTAGLLGSLGLPSQNTTTSVTCTPAAISSH
ncbi:hypothetical protein J7W19_20050 [Streptomyces mobaraensis NBRC 13819 = DSM 40847]|uniref:Uncharacterized protein n=2 Tax=Streptomyces mobaraensis TaxID=35621 RepID=A0A5N5WIA0_STRMB|nr:hypothetical protein [Streptomyces mobaraensis]EME99984.1 hypothetical protein H340_13446 [Streptomyces mobaraensis NBRC 13819 = DSM 40847]KAB7852849.1 hypothetical protein FRZ00_01205 [Streptomyces mobaraensis]QTT75362.1 hypothetical protein J7W19_20050 [Streptomyces mobaraensis NBRC 13819 = DSM 40847]